MKLADFPTLFGEIRQPDSDYVLVPAHSSEGREIVPFEFCTKDQIGHNSCLMISNASPFHFGVLQSSMHMAWMRQVCGRIKGDYRYSNNLVYNNYPWPELPAADRVAAVEAAARGILEARAQFPKSSLADLYDPLSTPPVLVRAHRTLDVAVDKCYRKAAFKSELERVEFLFELYERFCSGLTAGISRDRNSAKRRVR